MPAILPAVNTGIDASPAYDQTLFAPENRLDSCVLTPPKRAVSEMVGKYSAYARVGGDQILLRLPQVGPALEQLGGQTGRHRGRIKLADLAPAHDRPRVASEQ